MKMDIEGPEAMATAYQEVVADLIHHLNVNLNATQQQPERVETMRAIGVTTARLNHWVYRRDLERSKPPEGT